ncbi:MAG: type II secretion system GspH family protein, partial [Candidatus Gastranaerophilales bacterium]|nr:type II secretion system GspH family protein [Candidatus Gastranaerophilales bacterium]
FFDFKFLFYLDNAIKRSAKRSIFITAKPPRKSCVKPAYKPRASRSLAFTNLARIRWASPAFTLAETLITLAIIGVVAAMTIPSVLNHYREQEIVSKVKKIYSTFSSAIQLAIYENGTIDTWDLAPKSGNYDRTSAAKFAEYIKPYLKVMTDCGTDSDNECMDDTLYKLLKGNNHVAYGSNSNYYKIILADGSLVWWRTNGSSGCASSDGEAENVCAIIWFDINGKKDPNQIGRDTFSFQLLNNSIIPNSANGNDCYLNAGGWSCVAHVIEYGNLNYPEKK